MPHSCPAISTPYWTLPGLIQAPGSWLLLTIVAVVALVWARRVVAPVASWRARIPVALAYGLAVIMLLAALFILTLVLPPYQDASEMESLYFQPGASQAATDCAIEHTTQPHRMIGDRGDACRIGRCSSGRQQDARRTFELRLCGRQPHML